MSVPRLQGHRRMVQANESLPVLNNTGGGAGGPVTLQRHIEPRARTREDAPVRSCDTLSADTGLQGTATAVLQDNTVSGMP